MDTSSRSTYVIMVILLSSQLTVTVLTVQEENYARPQLEREAFEKSVQPHLEIRPCYHKARN
jgi:hypothetical protein